MTVVLSNKRITGFHLLSARIAQKKESETKQVRLLRLVFWLLGCNRKIKKETNGHNRRRPTLCVGWRSRRWEVLGGPADGNGAQGTRWDCNSVGGEHSVDALNTTSRGDLKFGKSSIEFLNKRQPSNQAVCSGRDPVVVPGGTSRGPEAKEGRKERLRMGRGGVRAVRGILRARSRPRKIRPLRIMDPEIFSTTRQSSHVQDQQ